MKKQTNEAINQMAYSVGRFENTRNLPRVGTTLLLAIMNKTNKGGGFTSNEIAEKTGEDKVKMRIKIQKFLSINCLEVIDDTHNANVYKTTEFAKDILASVYPLVSQGINELIERYRLVLENKKASQMGLQSLNILALIGVGVNNSEDICEHINKKNNTFSAASAQLRRNNYFTKTGNTTISDRSGLPLETFMLTQEGEELLKTVFGDK